jgi:hypothetical protein
MGLEYGLYIFNIVMILMPGKIMWIYKLCIIFISLGLTNNFSNHEENAKNTCNNQFAPCIFIYCDGH